MAVHPCTARRGSARVEALVPRRRAPPSLPAARTLPGTSEHVHSEPFLLMTGRNVGADIFRQVAANDKAA
jgi:hypothetical protein